MYVQILRSQFEYTLKLVGNRMKLVTPGNGTFPTYSQFARFIKKVMGEDAWHKVKISVTRARRTQMLPR